jgi:hypothetical protein
MAATADSWEDRNVQRLAKPAVAWPVEVVEFEHRALRRRTNRLILIVMALAFVALGTIFALAGIFPGLVDEERVTVTDERAQAWLAAILFGLPFATGLLVRWLIQPRIRRRPDEADHPWRFQATRESLRVDTAGGRFLEGPWSRWRYAGYRYALVKNNRIPTALVIACEGEEIGIEFSRFPRRAAGQLAAAVLQGLASAGHGDRTA